MIKVLAYDLDGTALNSAKEITPRAANAIARAIDRGILAIPCTGREIESVPECVMETPGLRYLIANNGAQVYTMPERELIYSNTIEASVALRVLSECRDFSAFIFAGDGVEKILDTKCAMWEDEEKRKLLPEFVSSIELSRTDLKEYITRTGNPLFKLIFLFYDEEEFGRIWDRLSGMDCVSVTSSGPENVEVMPRGTSKGEALKFVCSRIGAELSEVMAIGDNHNDIEMIVEAGYSVAMSNSIAKLRELADSVTLSCDEDGFAIAIERRILNEDC